MTQEKPKNFGRETLHEVLRINLLVQRFGMTPAQAALVAGLAWAGDE